MIGIANDGMTDAKKTEGPLSGYVGFWREAAVRLVDLAFRSQR